jgi:hypothetical protein
MIEQNTSGEYVLLEEVLRKAMDEAVLLAKKAGKTEREKGEIYAYLDLLSWAKAQAEVLGVTLSDSELAAFDPYSLIDRKTKAA